MKSVLVLGAGLVAKPMIKYLLDKGYSVSLADMVLSKAQAIIAAHPNGNALSLKVEDEAMLEKMVAEHDIAVSLLPYVYHPVVAKCCLRHKKNLVTASYVKEQMRALDNDVKKAGLLFLNEVGLDPGLDHMSAKRVIDTIHNNGGKVEEFYSLTGALPAPESADNPFRYKFSWSPKGVVLAGNNDARFLKDGKVVEVKTQNLFKHPFSVEFPEAGTLEVYPNRDSLEYIQLYNIPEVKTMYRGTLRFHGWCVTVNAMKKLNLISNAQFDFTGKTYADFIAMMIGVNDIIDIRQKVADHLKMRYNSYSLKTMEWLGLFDNIRMNRGVDTPFEITSDLMISKMMLKENERDMVVMQHNFLASYSEPRTTKYEVIRSRMLDFGSLKTDTAVARTVALPAAIAVDMILNKQINITGVHIPTIPQIYEPILHQLENFNIKLVEEYGLPLSQRICN